MSLGKTLVLARHDSFFKAGLCHAQTLRTDGSSIDLVCLTSKGSGLSSTQAAAFGLDQPIRNAALCDVCTRDFLERYDVVLLGLDGRPSRDFLRRFHALYATDTQRRPLIISYFPGVIFRYHLEGMQSRMSADLLLLNSRNDMQLYDGFLRGLGVSDNNSLCTGLSYIEQFQVRPQLGDTLLFFGQPSVPTTLEERAYVVERMVALARRFPHCRVVLKPRHRPCEQSLHQDRFHFADLLNACDFGPIPENFSLSYEPVRTLLERTRLALTVSSSAAVETLAAGIPTRIITDYGIHENLGNHLFLGSGLLCTFDDITDDMPYVLEPEWRQTHMTLPSEAGGSLVAAVDRLLCLRREQGQLPVRHHRLLGRAAPFVEFADQKFAKGSYAEFATPKWGRVARQWRLSRFWSRLRRSISGA